MAHFLKKNILLYLAEALIQWLWEMTHVRQIMGSNSGVDMKKKQWVAHSKHYFYKTSVFTFKMTDHQ